jgi:hypothetical protein
MKILKNRARPVSADDAAAAIRLGAITARGNAQASAHAAQQLAEKLLKAPIKVRRFWTPDEIAAGVQ